MMYNLEQQYFDCLKEIAYFSTAERFWDLHL